MFLLGNLKFSYNHCMIFLLEEGHFSSFGNVRCPCSFGQNKRYKKSAHFFLLHGSSLKTVFGISHFRFYLVFIKLYIFGQQKV